MKQLSQLSQFSQLQLLQYILLATLSLITIGKEHFQNDLLIIRRLSRIIRKFMPNICRLAGYENLDEQIPLSIHKKLQLKLGRDVNDDEKHELLNNQNGILFRYLIYITSMLWDNNLSMTEKAKREEYLKTKINEGFSLFYDKKKNFIEKKEVPYVMRYLGQFPSEAQVRDAILPEIEEDQPLQSIKYSKFEPYMLRVLKEQEFEPDEPETVLAAFRLLDPEGKGFIQIEQMKRHLETSGIEFGQKQTQDFVEFATNKDPQAKVIYYEDYLSRLYSFVDKHLDNIMKGYPTFQSKK